jgi:hypothetical protein
MGLLSQFKRKKQSEPTAQAVSLTVLYATARDGLSAEAAFALRDIISASSPLDFEFLNPGAFTVYFNGEISGKAQADKLVQALRQYAGDNAISSFGVAAHVGECITAFDTNGRMASRPLGLTINHAMSAAIKEASANAL